MQDEWLMVEIVCYYVSQTEKGYNGRFLTGFSIEMAKTVGARPSEIKRMESAFEHDDLALALRL
jgi:hypothetical protein